MVLVCSIILNKVYGSPSLEIVRPTVTLSGFIINFCNLGMIPVLEDDPDFGEQSWLWIWS